MGTVRAIPEHRSEVCLATKRRQAPIGAHRSDRPAAAKACLQPAD